MATLEINNEAQIFTCKSCGRTYIVRKCEAQYVQTDEYLNYCCLCRKAFNDKRIKEKEE